jgi:hypothetical protein
MGSLFKFFEGAIVEAHLPPFFFCDTIAGVTDVFYPFLSLLLSFEDVNASFSFTALMHPATSLSITFIQFEIRARLNNMDFGNGKWVDTLGITRTESWCLPEVSLCLCLPRHVIS